MRQQPIFPSYYDVRAFCPSTTSQQPTLPRKYSSADTTDLELEVVADQENEFEIVLTDQGLRREHRAASTAPFLR